MNFNNSAAAPTGPSIGGYVFRIVLMIAGLFAIYYAYKALFTSDLSRVVVIQDVHAAKTDEKTKPYIFDKSVLPPLYEGGEYTISAWIYVNDFAYRRGYNKDIFTLGNHTDANGTVTLGVYLDGTENTLHVRTSYVSNGAVSSGTMKLSEYNALFATPNQISSLSNIPDCMVSPIEFQRWVHVAVAMNGKTTDVYVDGKLARSCVLPSIYRTDGAYSLTVANHMGFGGFISGVAAYDYAINPEQVYRTYMAGPVGAIDFMTYLKSFFDPQAVGTMDYPKMN
jgi:hypothetical protein